MHLFEHLHSETPNGLLGVVTLQFCRLYYVLWSPRPPFTNKPPMNIHVRAAGMLAFDHKNFYYNIIYNLVHSRNIHIIIFRIGTREVIIYNAVGMTVIVPKLDFIQLIYSNKMCVINILKQKCELSLYGSMNFSVYIKFS